MALVYLAHPAELSKPADGTKSIVLTDDGYYWFLHRYFEAANLDRSSELIDLYGGRIVEGYQLRRLRSELEIALDDARNKPKTWSVFTGWSDTIRAVETESWQSIDQQQLLDLINALLDLLRTSEASKLKVVCSGD